MNTGAKRKLTKPRMPSAAREGEGSDFRFMMRSALYALCITLICAIIFLVVLSIIAYSNPDPDTLVAPFSYSALFASALIGGIAAARINRRAGLICGTLSGLLFLIVIFIASLFAGGGETNVSFGIALAFYAGVVLTAAAGGMLGSKRAKPRRRKIK